MYCLYISAFFYNSCSFGLEKGKTKSLGNSCKLCNSGRKKIISHPTWEVRSITWIKILTYYFSVIIVVDVIMMKVMILLLKMFITLV